MAVFAAAACRIVGTPPDPDETRERVERAQREREERRGQIERDVPALERRVAGYPGDLEAREELMRAYFELALEARQNERMREYTDYLARSYDQAFAILALEPRNAAVHVHMGLVAAYQGDVARARRSFENARRLEPRRAVHYLNVAEAYVYLGKTGAARHYVTRARRLGAPPATTEMIDLLAAWRRGDRVEEEELFDITYTLNPDYVQAWNDPDDPIDSLRELKDHCCTLAFCGPNMPGDCPPGALRAALPTVDPETVRRELELEMLRRRRLREIYEDRKDLEIEVEPVEPEE